MAQLPPDVILLICEELGDQRAFGTLFSAALLGKHWARSALLWMYRVHEQSPIRSDDTTETRVSKTDSVKTTSKWALQWRSIIMSSLGKTAYPYCLYMRSLDLTNLNDLFNENQFWKSLHSQFFADDMHVFVNQTSRRRKPDSITIINRVGESIAKFTGDSAERNGGTAALEELRGDIDKDALPQWVGRLPRLKSLTLWKGSVLNKSLADIIKNHCPDFNNLSLYEGKGNQVDSDLASFFENLPSNNLNFFQIISHNEIGPQTFLALNNHHASLKQLMLGSLPASAIKALPLLKGCTAIQTLELHDMDGRIDLEATEYDAFLELIAWLTSCKNLKSISLRNFVNGPKILTSVCLENEIRLESLLLVKYPLQGNQDFHRALVHQMSLESLYLKADAEDFFRDDIDTLVASLRKLENLKYLNILDLSDYFRTTEIQLIAMSLSKLEDFSVGGYDVTDEVWRAISTLPHLHSMSFHAVTSFTFDAILDYISKLRPTNAGLQLSVMCASPGSKLNESELAIIRTALAEKVDGRFDFEMYREAESEVSSDSD